MPDAPLRAIAVLALAAAVLPGCARFRESRRVDVGPFAENVMHLVSEVQPGSGTQEILFIRSYLPVPSSATLRDEWGEFQALLAHVNEYVVQVVAIAESSRPEPERARELARFLDGPVRAALKRQGALAQIDGGPLDGMIAQARRAPDLLAALQAAQPVVEEILRLSDVRAARIRAAQVAFGLEVGAKIDQAYAGTIGNLRELESLQEKSIDSYALVVRARVGEAGAVGELRGRDASLRDLLGPGEKPPGDALERAERLLAERLARIKTLRDQVGPEVELYVRTKAELNRVLGLSESHAARGRLAVIAFARSHRNLAAGLAVPPEIDVLGLLKSGASGAAGKIL